MTQLRQYQRDAIDGIWRYWERASGNPLVVAPTGSGKSVMIAAFCQEAQVLFPGTKLLIVTHVKELIAQNYKAMMRAWPTAPAGIYSAGLGVRVLSRPITFAGIQSVHRKAALFGHVDLMIVDEAHLIPRSAKTMYGRFIAALREVNPYLKVIGFTATPSRLDSGRLDEGEGRIFDGIAYDIQIGRLVDEGYLAPLVGKATALELDVSGVGRRGGEFIESELQRAVDKEQTTRAAVRETIRFGQGRKAWLLFCTGVAHAQHVAEELRRNGVSAACVHGETPKGERDRLLDSFKRGNIRAITNANILTTGFDYPGLDLIAFMRPTESAELYVQMAGRGMRTAPGKRNCLVLDFARNIERHGPVDAITVKDKKKRKGQGESAPPIKVCEHCLSIVYAAVRVCPDCGNEFEVERQPDITPTASDAAVMARDVKPAWLPVSSWQFSKHVKPGSRPTLRVDYRCGIATYKEWLAFEHVGYPAQKAGKWWQARGGREPIPESVDWALERQEELTMPAEILLRRVGKYFEVLSYRNVSDEKEEAA